MSWRYYAKKPKPKNENWNNLKFNPNVSKLRKGGYSTEIISSKYGRELPYQKYVASQEPGYHSQKDIDYAKNFVGGAKEAVMNNPDAHHLPKWLLRHTRSYRFRQNWYADRASEQQNRLQMRNEEDAKRNYDKMQAKQDALDAHYWQHNPKWRAMSTTARRWIKRAGNESKYMYSVGPQHDAHVKYKRAFINKKAAEKLQRNKKRKRNAEALVPKDVIDLT